MGDTTATTRGRRAVGPALGLVAAVGLWPVVAWVFSSDRALGFRDEGLYLLAADPPTPTARWVTPFGWHTAPFFRLLGHDVARLRTFAVWTLVVAGWVTGRALARHLVGDGRGPADRAGRLALGLAGALGGPLLTSGLLRTPGYNWVNLVGLLLAVAGAAQLASLGDAPPWRSGAAHRAAALTALGLVFTVPAKPSSAPLLYAAVALLLWWPRHARRRALLAMVAAWSAALVVLAVVTMLWPVSFLAVLARSATFPPLHENQTIPGALKDVLRTPKVAWHDLRLLRPAAMVLTAAAVASAAAIVVARRRGRVVGGALAAVPLVLATVAAVGTAVPWPLVGVPNPFVRFAWYGTTDAAVLLMVGALAHLAVHRADTDAHTARRALAAALLCVVAVFVFGFGSALSIYHQAALAASLMWCACAAVVVVTGTARVRTFGAVLVVAATTAMFVSNTVDSRHRPFDSTEVADQTTPVRLGRHDDELLVDPTTARYLRVLQADARAAGWCTSDRLIGTVWGWTSTESFALGATVPEHLIVTIFGYENAQAVVDLVLRHDLRDPAWRDAWVMTSRPNALIEKRAAEVRRALDGLPAAIDRTFPADYTMVAEVDATQLWRPTDHVPPPCR